jgi:hypothetical protein
VEGITTMKKKTMFKVLMVAGTLSLTHWVLAADNGDMGKMDGTDHGTVSAAKPTPVSKASVKKAKKTKKVVAAKTATVAAVYVCPMGHYTGDKPGKCPICGMDLVKKEATAKP